MSNVILQSETQVMLGTMTVFVRLHYSYKAEMNSGDVSHNDDSICKITFHCAQHHLSLTSGLYE
jgi:hypothetical protein